MATFQSAITDLGAEGQMFTIFISSVQQQVITVETGYGTEDFVVGFSEEGTPIQLMPDATGTVKFYGDPTLIDYLYCEGGYLTAADLSQLVNLDILELKHNELEHLDLTSNINLRYVDLSDNKFVSNPLIIGPKPGILALTVDNIGLLDPSFNLSDYPSIKIFTAWGVDNLTHIDPTGCPDLMRLSIDSTQVSTLDVTNNPALLILNISDTAITDIDLTHNPLLREFYANRESWIHGSHKISSIDLSCNPELYYLFLNGNHLTELDLTNNPLLFDLGVRRNHLTQLDLDENPDLYKVDLSYNNFNLVTLPENRKTWSEYYYKQNPMPVSKAYKVGSAIDLGYAVNRPGAEVFMALFSVSEEDPANPVEIEADRYQYADGVITLTQELPDSVYAEFWTPSLPDCAIATTRFKVKPAVSFGQPDKVVEFAPQLPRNRAISFGVGMAGATEENPVEFTVDFGDGVQEKHYATSQTGATANVEGIVKGNIFKIYQPEGQEITSFCIQGTELGGLDVTQARTLRELTVTGAKLRTLDLQWNRCLTDLTLNGNRFDAFSLAGANSGYGKNVLAHVNLSSNQIKELTLSEPSTMRTLDLSNNYLQEIDLTNGFYITDVNLSHNGFDFLNLQPLDAVERLDISYNRLGEVILPELGQPSQVDVSMNYFTYIDIPYLPEEVEEYTYAPQRPVEISTKGPGVNLSKQNLDILGHRTQYKWIDAAGNVLTEGTDYSITNGRTRFLRYDLGKVHCAMTNAAYPAFTGDNALMTTDILVAEPPTNEIGYIDVTGTDGTPYLSMAGNKENMAVYINWDGQGHDYDEYLLTTTYRLSYPDVYPGQRARMYTYDEEEALTVFAMHNIRTGEIDMSRMSELSTLNIDNADASNIRMPEETSALTELLLTNGDYAGMSFEQYPNLYVMLLQYCGLESFDASKYPNLGVLTLSHNYLSNVKLDNPDLWSLDLSMNELPSIDLSKVPSMNQISLAQNLLTDISTVGMPDLHVLFLDYNALTFATLPLPDSQWSMYTYANQAMLQPAVTEYQVDLSDQAWCGGVETTYYWFQDMPWLNEEGELDGDFLVEGTDYTINDGVTKFLHPVSGVMCVMVNEELPDLLLLTMPLSLPVSGVEATAAAGIRVSGLSVEASGVADGTAGSLYTLDGICVSQSLAGDSRLTVSAPEAGIYIAKIGNFSIKVTLK